MKRTYSDMATTLSVLPQLAENGPEMFKSTLPGPYKLRVSKVTDISKPAQRPVDEIEEPEEEDIANANRLNKGNARMIQLDLKDANGKLIKAMETERIEMLTEVKPNYIINISGPVELRCGNIMLQKRNLSSVEPGPAGEPSDEQVRQPKPDPGFASAVQPEAPVKEEFKQEVIQLDEDWDDDDDDDDDCVIIVDSS